MEKSIVFMNWETRHFKDVKFYTECKSYQNSSKVCCVHRAVYSGAMWKYTEPRIPKTILENLKGVKDFSPKADFHVAIVIKIVWCWQKNRPSGRN